MLVLEAKLEETKKQYEKLNEAIRTARLVPNSCLRYWMDNKNIGKYDLSAYCGVLASQFELAKNLNSMAGQARAEREWSVISRFYDNCKKHKPRKKEYPRFKKEQTHGSVEYKTSGWKLSEERRYITFYDDFKAGTFKMWGTCDWHFYQLKQIKRVRVVRRADGY
jgi:putative transposase